MSKKGFTLIETAISMFLIAVVMLSFLEALHIGITGTTQLSRKTSALNLAKSQFEHTKSREYVAASGDLDTVYGLITTVEEVSDTINYVITGQVSNVSSGIPLQQITVNVDYLVGRDVQLTGYKTGDGSLFDREPSGMLVTDNIKRAPTLPQGYGGFCLGTFRGYYHVFTTGTAGPVSIHWKFDWEKTVSYNVLYDLGAPIIALYQGIPPWVLRDSKGEVKKNAMIVRNQNGLWLADLVGIGDLPGPGAGETMCSPCADDDMYEGEANPIYYKPHHCDPHLFLGFIPTNLGWIACLLGGSTGPYPCCGACKTGADEREDYFWRYHGSEASGTAEDTLVTGNLEPGTYTVLFFNSENMRNFDTISASVSYFY